MKSFYNPVPGIGAVCAPLLKRCDGNPVVIALVLFTAGFFPISKVAASGPIYPKICCAEKQVKDDNPLPQYNAYVVSEGCTLSFASENTPIVLTDCDGSGSEKGAWTAPVAKATGGCGPISLVQTAGPTPGVEIPVGKYDITYTAMAVDKKSGAIVRVMQSFSIETKKDAEPPVVKDLPAQTLKKGNKIPDFSKLAEASDNCTTRAKLRFVQQPAAGTPFDGVQKSVKLIVTDLAGNQTTSTIRVK